MTPFLVLIFMLLPNGNVTAHSDPQMYVGADQCLEVLKQSMNEMREEYQPVDMTGYCVDSKLFPGEGA
jgi:uncharacterized SAM-dependent methyltransferase